MAKTKKENLDDFDFDDDIFAGIDMGDEDSPSPKGGKPIGRLLKSFAQGARESLTSGATLKEMARRALPASYESGFQAYDATRETTRQLYNSAADELRPMLPGIRRAAEKLADSAGLSEKNQKRLRDFAAGGTEHTRAPSAEDIDNNTIEESAAAVFGRDKGRSRRSDGSAAERYLRERVQDKRSDLSLQMGAEANNHLRRLTAYQDHVTYKFQQKSLENSYRQIFLLRDMLNLQRETAGIVVEGLRAITHNTSLPDFQKQGAGSALRESFRDRLVNNISDSASKFSSNFFTQLKTNALNKVKDSLGGVGGGLEGGMDAWEMLNDAGEMTGEGVSGILANMLGGAVASKLGPAAMLPFRKMLEKTSAGKRGGDVLTNILGQLPEKITRKVRDGDYDVRTWHGQIMSVLQEILPTGNRETIGAKSVLETADKPVPFTDITRRSIVEVIPGFLARIHREVAMLRTGGDVDMLTYNVETGRFADVKTAANSIKSRLFKKENNYHTQELTYAAVDKLDDGTLTAEERLTLARSLLDDATNNRDFSADYFGRDEVKARFKGKSLDKVAAAFKKNFAGSDGKPDYEKLNKFVESFTALKSGAVVDPRKGIGAYRGMGVDMDVLDQLGFLTEEDGQQHVDYSEFHRQVLTGEKKAGKAPKRKKENFMQKKIEEITGGVAGWWDKKAEGIANAVMGSDDFQRLSGPIGNRVASALENAERIFATGFHDDPDVDFADVLEETLKESQVPAKAKKTVMRVVRTVKAKTKRSKTVRKVVSNANVVANTVSQKSQELKDAVKDRLEASGIKDRAEEAGKGIKDRLTSVKDAAIDAAARAIDKNVDGKRERGGPVRKDKAYIVGEKEAEVFVPEQDGTIVPKLKRSAVDRVTGKGLEARKKKALDEVVRLREKIKTIDSEEIKAALTIRLDAAQEKIESAVGTPEALDRTVSAIKGSVTKYGRSLHSKVMSHVDQANAYVDGEGAEGSWDALMRGKLRQGRQQAQSAVTASSNKLSQARASAVQFLQSQDPQALMATLKSAGLRVQAAANGALQHGQQAMSQAIGQYHGQPLPQSQHEEEMLQLSRQQLQQLQAIEVAVRDLENQVGSGGDGGPARPGLLRRGFGGVTGLAWGGTKLFGRYLKGSYKGMWSITKGVAGTAGAAVGGAFNALSGKRRVADIYSKLDTKTPILFRVKLLRGAYEDAQTKKTIKSIDDIKGPVRDRTDGNIVLTDQDYQAGYFDTAGTSLVGKMTEGLKKVGGAFLGYSGSVMALPFHIGKQAIRFSVKAIETLNEGQDVYLEGKLNRAVLLNKHLKAGRYWSARKNRPIRSVKDVDGEIFEYDPQTKQKRVVISQDEFDNHALVNWRGRPIRSVGQSAVHFAKDVVSFAGRAALGIVKGYAKVIGGAARLVGGALSGAGGMFAGIGRFFNPKTGQGDSGAASVIMLQEIYKLLHERVPVPKKIRQGSWQQQLSIGKEQDAEEAKKKEEDKRNSKFSLAAMLGGAGKKLKGLFGFGDDEEDDEDDDDSLLDDAADVADIADATGDARERRRRRKAAKRRLKRMRRGKGGRFGRLGRVFGGARGAATAGTAARAGVGAGTVATAGLAAGAVGLAGGLGGGYAGAKGGDWLSDKFGLSEDSWARTGMNVGGGVAGGAAGLYGTSAAIGAMGGLGAVAAGAASVLASPVVLGAAVIGGTVYLGMKAIGAYKKRRDEPFRKLRLAQYGIDVKNIEHLEKVEALEDLCSDAVKMTPQGAQLNQQSLDAEAIYKLFEAESGGFLGFFKKRSQDRVTSLTQWFNMRFKPVFLTWRTAMQNGTSGKVTELADLWDKPDYDQRKKILSMVKVSEDIYNVGISPFGDSEIQTGSGPINNAFAEAEQAVEKDKSKGATKKALAKYMDTQLGKVKGAYAKGFARSAAMLDTIADKTKAIPAVSWMAKTMSALLKKGEKSLSDGKGEGKAVETGLSPGTRLTALQSIRYRAYGLRDMQTDRVNAVYILEKNVMKHVRYAASGAASFSKTGDALFEEFAQYFGIAVDEDKKKEAWIEWFNGRFLPSLLAFCSGAKAFVKGNIDILTVEQGLKAAQLIGIAKVTIAAKRKRMLVSDASIWSFTDSPWDPNESLNDDINSTRKYIEELQQKAKDEKVNEGNPAAVNAPKPKPNATPAPPKPAAKPTPAQAAAKPSSAPKGGSGQGSFDGPNDGPRDLQREADAQYWAGKGVDAASLQMDKNRLPPYKPVKMSGSAKQREKILVKTATEAGITDKNELATFMAQTAHESAHFDQTKENTRWSPSTMVKLWPKRFPSLDYAQQVHAQGPSAVAEKVYGGRMGNDQPGDGANYIGRGFIQLTGKDNYAAFQKRTGINVLNDPDVVARDPQVAAESAVDYWMNRGAGLRAAAQRGDIESSTKVVNGGLNGLPDRKRLFAYYNQNLDKLLEEKNAGEASGATPSAASAPAAKGSYDTTNVTSIARKAPVREQPNPATLSVPAPTRGGYAASMNPDKVAVSYARDERPDSGYKSAGGVGSSKAAKAAAIATQRANKSSTGKCAKFVSDALLACGYKFNKQPSAYMYESNGILGNVGFQQIDPSSPPQAGDIMVYRATGRHVHGHIQIFNGSQWVSDFMQRTVVPWSSGHGGFTLWRDTSNGKSQAGETATAAPAEPRQSSAIAPPDIAGTQSPMPSFAGVQGGVRSTEADRDAFVAQANQQRQQRTMAEQRRGQLAASQTDKVAMEVRDLNQRQLDTQIDIAKKMDTLIDAVKNLKLQAPADQLKDSGKNPDIVAYKPGHSRLPIRQDPKPARSPLSVVRSQKRG